MKLSTVLWHLTRWVTRAENHVARTVRAVRRHFGGTCNALIPSHIGPAGVRCHLPVGYHPAHRGDDELGVGWTWPGHPAGSGKDPRP